MFRNFLFLLHGRKESHPCKTREKVTCWFVQNCGCAGKFFFSNGGGTVKGLPLLAFQMLALPALGKLSFLIVFAGYLSQAKRVVGMNTMMANRLLFFTLLFGSILPRWSASSTLLDHGLSHNAQKLGSNQFSTCIRKEALCNSYCGVDTCWWSKHGIWHCPIGARKLPIELLFTWYILLRWLKQNALHNNTSMLPVGVLFELLMCLMRNYLCCSLRWDHLFCRSQNITNPLHKVSITSLTYTSAKMVDGHKFYKICWLASYNSVRSLHCPGCIGSVHVNPPLKCQQQAKYKNAIKLVTRMFNFILIAQWLAFWERHRSTLYSYMYCLLLR